MDETPAKPDRRPRFPWLVALLCAASLGVATWTWMRYSYAWDVDCDTIVAATTADGDNPWFGAYVRLGDGVDVRDSLMWSKETQTVWIPVGPEPPDVLAAVQLRSDMRRRAYRRGEKPPPEPNTWLPSVDGRVGWDAWDAGFLVVDTRSSRLHPASITGLVVGAMGVFVFAVYLRTWVKRRREDG